MQKDLPFVAKKKTFVYKKGYPNSRSLQILKTILKVLPLADPAHQPDLKLNLHP